MADAEIRDDLPSSQPECEAQYAAYGRSGKGHLQLQAWIPGNLLHGRHPTEEIESYALDAYAVSEGDIGVSQLMQGHAGEEDQGQKK